MPRRSGARQASPVRGQRRCRNRSNPQRSWCRHGSQECWCRCGVRQARGSRSAARSKSQCSKEQVAVKFASKHGSDPGHGMALLFRYSKRITARLRGQHAAALLGAATDISLPAFAPTLPLFGIGTALDLPRLARHWRKTASSPSAYCTAKPLACYRSGIGQGQQRFRASIAKRLYQHFRTTSSLCHHWKHTPFL